MTAEKQYDDSRQKFKTDTITDANYFRELIDYQPDTGLMFWRPRDLQDFHSVRIGGGWNTKFSGKQIPLVLNTAGYCIVSIWNRHYQAHRVAWAIHHGAMPENNIDHINGCRTDNRIKNLRDVTQEVNSRNQGVRSDNKTGISGIWDNKPKKWGKRWAVAMGGKSKMIWRSHHCLGLAVKERNEIYRMRGFTSDHGIRAAGQ